MNARGRDDRTLIRIAAMLVALAMVAERAGSRSLPVRWLVLCILRRAETVAHAFVMDAMPMEWQCFEEPLNFENRPIDAASLAWRLRTLAAMLGALLRMRCHPRFRNAAINRGSLRLASLGALITAAGWTPLPCDTS